MPSEDQHIAAAIAGLKALTDNLKSGQIMLLLARSGDAEWADGVPEIVPFNQAILTALRAVQQKRNKRSRRRHKEPAARPATKARRAVPSRRSRSLA